MGVKVASLLILRETGFNFLPLGRVECAIDILRDSKLEPLRFGNRVGNLLGLSFPQNRRHRGKHLKSGIKAAVRFKQIALRRSMRESRQRRRDPTPKGSRRGIHRV